MDGEIHVKLSLATMARLVSAAALLVLAVPAVAVPASAPVRSIVIFEDGAVNATAQARIELLGGVQIKQLPMVDGAVVLLPSPAAERALGKLPGIERVERDVVVSALGRPTKPGGTPPAETVPWGVTRVGAPSVWASNTADPIKVAVVDSGIDPSHPDLAANLKGGTSTVSYTTSYNDDNGHGSHVAGTIAAIDNSIGVVGVAPGADLYAVKVLDRRGSGYVSDIIEGLQWAAANDMDVVNMSLGTSLYSATFDTAVQQTVASGTVVVAAAGNAGPGTDTVEYPGKFANVIAVSATDSINAIASFSSRGPAIDLAAPGVDVYSTTKRGGYTTMSGTSMAAPHVAAAAALVMNSPIGTDDLDADGIWDPAEVERRLERTAQDIGPAGFESNYGNGLVRADRAVTP